MKLIIDIEPRYYKNMRSEVKELYYEAINRITEAVSSGIPYDERPQGEWIDYDNTFYKCPDCGYLLEKCCPQCQNKVILPKGGAE